MGGREGVREGERGRGIWMVWFGLVWFGLGVSGCERWRRERRRGGLEVFVGGEDWRVCWCGGWRFWWDGVGGDVLRIDG